MLTLGQTYNLRVVKIIDQGAYVDGEELGEILLPTKHCPPDLAVDSELAVFLYQDSESRLIVTTQTPKVQVGEFAYLKVVENTDYGSFMDWGLDKDLLLPFGEQHRPMEVDRSYLVYVYLNKADGRITASSKVEKFLDTQSAHDFAPGQQVDLIIANSTDLGFKAIINHSHWGLLYKDEVHERLSFGQSRRGFIKFVRPDGKIDLALREEQITRDQYTMTVVNYLKEHDGFAAAHDKTDPEIIQALFGMSKKSFKKVIGRLYKQRIIKIQTDGIRLNNETTKPTKNGT
ncbi:MAG: putative RNA-binding protein (virulence factor B family) [Gammaproteobacteria bacterium]|jgi:predicted RNA-binding protein (virulence factor B family)